MKEALATKGKSNRIAYIDVAKFIGILLVIYAHSLPGENKLCLILYSFHLPLFFVLNGMTTKFRKEDNFLLFLKRKIKSLIIPMFILGMMIGIEKMIVNTVNGDGIPEHYLLKVFVSLWEQKRQFALWFIGALMISDCLFYFCHWLGRDKLWLTGIFAFAVFMIGVYCNYNYKVPYGWNLDTGLIGVIFVFSGYLFSHSDTIHVRKVLLYNRLVSCLFGITLLAAGLALGYLNHKYFNSNLEMFACRYTEFYLTIPSAILSSFGVILICYTITNPLFAHLGQTTLVLYSMHQEFAFPFFRKFFEEFNTATNATAPNDIQRYLFALYQTLFSLAFLLPIYYLLAYSPLAMSVNRKQPGYMRWLYQKIMVFIKAKYALIQIKLHPIIVFKDDTFTMLSNTKNNRFLILNPEEKILASYKIKQKENDILVRFSQWNQEETLSSILSSLTDRYPDKTIQLDFRGERIPGAVYQSLGFQECLSNDKTTARVSYSYLKEANKNLIPQLP